MRALISLLSLLSVSSEWVLGQHEFGPVRLGPEEPSEAFCSSLAVNTPESLRVLWGPSWDPAYPGYGQTFSLDGVPSGAPERYDVSYPRPFDCTAYVRTVPLSSGGEARLLAHG